MYTNPCFQKRTPPERYGKKNHIFVIEKDLRPYGIIHSLADKKNSEKTLSRFGEWRICFSSDDRLPVPRRKEKGKEREIVDYSQLIYIYQHFYNVITKKNKIIKMLEKHFEEYENDYVEVKKKRDSLFEHYPAHAMKIDNVFSTEGIYDFKKRVLVDLKNADAIQLYGTEDLKNDKDTYYNIWKLIEKGSVVDNGVIDPLVALRIQSIYHPDQYIGINDQTVIDLILIELSLPLLTEQSIENKYQMIQNWITKNFSFAKDDPYKNNYFFIRAACDALDIPFATSQISLAVPEADLKHNQKAIEITEVLLTLIVNGQQQITYSELSDMTESKPSAYYEIPGLLDAINMHCHSLNLPVISAIVVNKKTGLPGDGFLKLCVDTFGYDSNANITEIVNEELKRIADCDSWYLLADSLGIKMPSDDAKLPEEMEEPLCAPLFEGAKRIITVNSYERDPRAKRECKEYYLKRDGKIVCQICGFDFGKVYGAEYQNMIHVHHIIPISTINKEYKVNPVKDLIPVCPNCHMVLHSGEGISIDDLRKRLM